MFGAGTLARSERASVVAETGSDVGMTGPLLSRGGGRLLGSRGSRFGHGARRFRAGSLGTMRGRSFARGAAALVVPIALETSTLTVSGVAERVGPNVLSIAHWSRLDDGELYAPLSRVDWATLLRRTFSVDFQCPRCGGRLGVRALVIDPEAIAARLVVLRRSRDPPAAA
jgi:hypothetical protein